MYRREYISFQRWCMFYIASARSTAPDTIQPWHVSENRVRFCFKLALCNPFSCSNPVMDFPTLNMEVFIYGHLQGVDRQVVGTHRCRAWHNYMGVQAVPGLYWWCNYSESAMWAIWVDQSFQLKMFNYWHKLKNRSGHSFRFSTFFGCVC